MNKKTLLFVLVIALFVACLALAIYAAGLNRQIQKYIGDAPVLTLTMKGPTGWTYEAYVKEKEKGKDKKFKAREAKNGRFTFKLSSKTLNYTIKMKAIQPNGKKTPLQLTTFANKNDTIKLDCTIKIKQGGIRGKCNFKYHSDLFEQKYDDSDGVIYDYDVDFTTDPVKHDLISNGNEYNFFGE